MFFKRQEQKKRHPLCGLMVGALTTVGACAVVSMVKQKVQTMCCGMKQFFGMSKKTACCKPMATDGSCGHDTDMTQEQQ